MNFIWLVFAHFIGDFALQSSWMAENKGRYWYVMLSHSMIWAGCVSIALQYLDLFHIWKVVFLVILHMFCDFLKVSKTKDWKYIYPDQIFHFIQLLIIYRV